MRKIMLIFNSSILVFDRKSIADCLLCWLTYLAGGGFGAKTNPQQNEMSFSAN